jgi:hypothetical protein
VEVLREVERCQRPLAVLEFVFGRPPFQQGFPLFRCQLPDPSPAQVLLRCPVDALVGQAAMIHPRRVAVLLEVGVLHLGPPLPGFQAAVLPCRRCLSGIRPVRDVSRCTV